jgi:hypothetical protein
MQPPDKSSKRRLKQGVHSVPFQRHDHHIFVEGQNGVDLVKTYSPSSKYLIGRVFGLDAEIGIHRRPPCGGEDVRRLLFTGIGIGPDLREPPHNHIQDARVALDKLRYPRVRSNLP